MKAKLQTTEPLQTAKSRDDRPQDKTATAPVDPGSDQPVVRDLRFKRFVADVRQFYFLNQTDDY